LELTTAEVVVGELRNHATRRSGSRAFRTSLEARSEVEKKTALVNVRIALSSIRLSWQNILHWIFVSNNHVVFLTPREKEQT
jgi:hypothetical protein